jgi:hypothetical protein
VDLFMKNFKKNNGVDGSERGPVRVLPGRDDTRSPEALRLSSGSDRSGLNQIGARRSDPA